MLNYFKERKKKPTSQNSSIISDVLDPRLEFLKKEKEESVGKEGIAKFNMNKKHFKI